MTTASVIIGCVTEAKLVESVVAQIAAMRHPDIETEIIVVDQSGTSALAAIPGITRIIAPKVDAGTAINVGLGAASGEYAVTLDADAFPIHPGWLSVPIGLIQRHGYVFVGNSTGMHEYYAPQIGQFLHINNYYRISRADVAKEIAAEIGFQRVAYRTLVGGVDTDNGVRAMRHAATLGTMLSLPITACLGHTPEMGLYGMVIDDLVFHLVFGFAEDWIKTLEKTLGHDFLTLRAKFTAEGFTSENIAAIRRDLLPVTGFGMRLWDGEKIATLPHDGELAREIAFLKIEAAARAAAHAADGAGGVESAP